MNIDKIIKKHLRSVINEDSEDGTYMVLSNLVQMQKDIETILKFKHHPKLKDLVTGEHAWAGDHIATSKDDIQEVANFIENTMSEMGELNESQLDEKCWVGYKEIGGKIKNGKKVPNCVPKNEMTEQEMYESMEVDESKNCPTDPGKWAASKAAAKAKFDVYPSAYANGWAAKNYKSKGGGWRKCK